MKHYEAIAIVPGTNSVPSDQPLLAHQAGGFTLFTNAKPRPVIALPMSRKQALLTAAARQSALESLMPLGPVITFRPGVSLAAEDAIPLVNANAKLLMELTKRFDGLVQYQITVSWAADRVLSRFRDCPELSPHFKRGHVTPTGLQEAVQRLARRLEGEMIERLSYLATDLLSLPLVEDMLLNAVVLLPPASEHRLDAAVEAIDAMWTDGFAIRQIGPSPPASFAMLDFQMMTAKDVTQAQARLGLAPDAGLSEINAARRRALLQQPSEAATIRAAADVLCAATNARTTEFPLCHVVSEGQSASAQQREVA